MSVLVVTLKDGFEIELNVLAQTHARFRKIIEENKTGALFELVKKCNDETKSYHISPESKKILREYDLLNEDERVPKLVKKVVFNSITKLGPYLKFSNPIRKEVCRL